MFLNRHKIGAVVLMAVLAFTSGSLLLYATTPLSQPKPKQSINTPVRNAGKKSRKAKPMQPKISMVVSAPRFRKPNPKLLPNFTYWELKVQYKNESTKEIVLSPFVNIKVYDAANKPVPNDVRIGAGFIAEDWMAQIEKQFLVIPPGKTRDVLVMLSDNRSPGGTIGWEFKKPGTYKITVTYKHSRKAFTSDYINGRFFFSEDALQKAELPERLWNRAVEMERTVEARLAVKSNRRNGT